MFQSEQLQEKWAPLLNHEGCEEIKDSHRRAVTAVLLENQEKFLHEQNAFGSSGLLNEAPTNAVGSDGFQGGSAEAGPTAGFDPVLISLIRRSMPNLIAYDLAGVQPMSGPTGLIFAMRSQRLKEGSRSETFYDEVDSSFSGQDAGFDLTNGMTDRLAGMGLLPERELHKRVRQSILVSRLEPLAAEQVHAQLARYLLRLLSVDDWKRAACIFGGGGEGLLLGLRHPAEPKAHGALLRQLDFFRVLERVEHRLDVDAGEAELVVHREPVPVEDVQVEFVLQLQVRVRMWGLP